MVFVELLAMAEDAFGEAAVDSVIDSADLPSGGAYTAVGNYSCDELMALVRGFSQHSGIPAPELQRLFGHWMMNSFVRHYPDFFVGRNGSLDMLAAIEDEIHVEVRKLYPDADLPHFDIHRPDAHQMHMTYRSPRPLADFCHGLIEGCVSQFGETAVISREDRKIDDATEADFQILIKNKA
ncbi:heme NO-binding domain-containing protein [Pseudotabrizicola sp.]|nr:heme NO-binding domain-containing protein [Pseudotabrizicola sp.]MDO8882475.1 heme NO-binding domain-containing protein [Pseudotabrizicola sp.]MDP2079670.1 heme NO-binding domain-containing protein [Pseudotabrizicola sp.]